MVGLQSMGLQRVRRDWVTNTSALPAEWDAVMTCGFKWLSWSGDFDFQACSLPSSTSPAMHTSAPMRPAGRRGQRRTASWWSMCLGGPCAMPSAGSAMAAAPTPKASGAPVGTYPFLNDYWRLLLGSRGPVFSLLLFISTVLQFRS